MQNKINRINFQCYLDEQERKRFRIKSRARNDCVRQEVLHALDLNFEYSRVMARDQTTWKIMATHRLQARREVDYKIKLFDA